MFVPKWTYDDADADSLSRVLRSNDECGISCLLAHPFVLKYVVEHPTYLGMYRKQPGFVGEAAASKQSGGGGNDGQPAAAQQASTKQV